MPVVSSFTPSSGGTGTTVVITGSNFDATPANNIVYFGATRANVTAASTTSLTVTSPAEANYQLISVLNTTNGLIGYSKQPFINTFSPPTFSFRPKVDIAANSKPMSIVTADFNNDGLTDLAVANNLSNTLSVLTNTSTISNISFGTKLDITTGTNPYGIAIADMDGDGKIDIVVVNSGSSSLWVFKNTSATGGVISFAAPVSLTTTANPKNLLIADMDGDGKADIITAPNDNNIIDVFRNTSTVGAVSFTTKQSLGIGGNTQALIGSDLDGDGKPELIGSVGGGITILQNNSHIGTISFVLAVNFSTHTLATGIAVGDIDGDGKTDIAVTNAGVNNVSVLVNTSTVGTVAFATEVNFPTGTTPTSVAINDINGDGKPDLVVGNNAANTVSVLQSSSSVGALSFNAAVNYPTGVSPTAVVSADFDGDGRPDLAITNGTDGTISTLLNIWSILPVNGLSFNVIKQTTSVQVNWSTLSETDSKNFDVQRSGDGFNFEVLGTIQAAGVSTVKSSYTFEDKHPIPGLDYYRLAQRDIDGKVKLSTTLIVSWQNTPNITLALAPQPIHSLATVNITGNIPASKFTIYDGSGKAIKTYTVSARTGSFSIDRTNMPTGIYFYRIITDAGETKGSGRIIAD